MDDRKLLLQLKIILVTYRAESRRLPREALHALRLRAAEIIDRLEQEANGDARLIEEIAKVRAEIGFGEDG